MYVCMFTITQRKDKVIFKVTKLKYSKAKNYQSWVISDFSKCSYDTTAIRIYLVHF